MSQTQAKPVPGGTHRITPHIVVRDAARAVEWYKQAFGAEECSRVPVPGGKLMSVELRFGDSTVMVADEFPEMGDRHGQLTDPYGHRWGLAQHLRDVPHEEIVRAAAAAFGG
jgi:PhnB protein